ncbi:MAG TPA: hypothetical protein VMC08_05185, partial [Bacteroidales bacterium]|nr:hypothetical protein [Bacteroidales bacterium]
NESIFTEEESAHLSNKKITFPSVREGSVIELQYTIRSPFLDYLRNWEFQGEIPERWSEYEVRIPEFFNYSTQITGFYPFTVQVHDQNPMSITTTSTVNTQNQWTSSASFQHNDVKYTEYSYRLGIENVPSFKEEPFTSSLYNYINAVRYEFISYQFPGEILHDVASTWEKVTENLLKDESLGGALKRGGLVKEIVSEINAKATQPFDKMLLAYEYVKNNLKWNGRNSKYLSGTIGQVFKDKVGNSADINLALLLLLRGLNLKADPVVLSTRKNGMVFESHPSLTDLNYVIADVTMEGKEYLLDATEMVRPYNMLPFKCLNGKGLVLSDSSQHWVSLLNEEKDQSLWYGDFTLDGNGKIEGSLKISTAGYQAASTRKDCLEKGKESYSKDFKEQLKNWDVGEVNIENLDNIREAVVTTCNVKSEEITEVNGDMIYFNVLLNQGEMTNPFGKEKREYPVDFGCPTKDVFLFTFEIPEGYQVLTLPEPVRISLPDQSASFKFLTSINNRKVTVSSTVQINKPVYYATEYEMLREFFVQVIAKHAQQIVLKKM